LRLSVQRLTSHLFIHPFFIRPLRTAIRAPPGERTANYLSPSGNRRWASEEKTYNLRGVAADRRATSTNIMVTRDVDSER